MLQYGGVVSRGRFGWGRGLYFLGRFFAAEFFVGLVGEALVNYVVTYFFEGKPIFL